MRFETVSGKARIAGNSWTISKIRNAAGGRFGLTDAVNESIRGSLVSIFIFSFSHFAWSAQIPGVTPPSPPSVVLNDAASTGIDSLALRGDLPVSRLWHHGDWSG